MEMQQTAPPLGRTVMHVRRTVPGREQPDHKVPSVRGATCRQTTGDRRWLDLSPRMEHEGLGAARISGRPERLLRLWSRPLLRSRLAVRNVRR